MVDASDDEVGAATDKAVQSHFYAVDRRARTSIHLKSRLAVHEFAGEGHVGSDATAGSRAWGVGGNNNDVGDGHQRVDEVVDARGSVTIVVGNKDVGSFFLHDVC